MKRLAHLAIGLLPSMPAYASSLLDLQGRVIQVATENDYPPLNYVDPATGKAAGWEYDALDEIARRLDAKIEWHAVSWAVLIQSVHSGDFDIGTDGIVITEARKQRSGSTSSRCERAPSSSGTGAD